MALAYIGALKNGDLTIDLRLESAAGGNFSLVRVEDDGSETPIDPDTTTDSRAIFTVPGAAGRTTLTAGVFNNSAGGTAGDFWLSVKQGDSVLTAAQKNDKPGNPCDLGNVAANQASQATFGVFL